MPALRMYNVIDNTSETEREGEGGGGMIEEKQREKR